MIFSIFELFFGSWIGYPKSWGVGFNHLLYVCRSYARYANTSTCDPCPAHAQATKTRMTVYVRAAGDGSKNTEFRFEDDNGTSAFYWIEANYAYTLVAPIKRAPLLDIANRIYRELNP